MSLQSSVSKIQMRSLPRITSSAGRTSARTSSSLCSRRYYSKHTVKENDIVLLKHRTNPSAPILTSKLRHDQQTSLFRDSIRHDDIIGKGLREVVTSKKGVTYRVLEPTLAEYTDNSPRIVTPIYSQDANLIVSLLDLHPPAPRPNHTNDNRLEIFEAGTGHGALTLHLAKAIHAANPAAPAIPQSIHDSALKRETSSPPSTPMSHASIEDDKGMAENSRAESGLILIPDKELHKHHPLPLSRERRIPLDEDPKRLAYDLWRSNRRAVIHTLDINAANSLHAEQVVKNFRNGIYFPHVDFHTGTIESYLSARLATSPEQPFLDHAILDLPSTQDYFDIVGKAMKPNGILIGFCPSITQINSCVLLVKQMNLPYFLEKVLEIGGGVGVGGREWDVRPVKPRALLKNEAEIKGSDSSGVIEVSKDSKGSGLPNDGWEMVCRPKVGVRVAGGGFVGVWRRIVQYP